MILTFHGIPLASDQELCDIERVSFRVTQINFTKNWAFMYGKIIPMIRVFPIDTSNYTIAILVISFNIVPDCWLVIIFTSLNSLLSLKRSPKITDEIRISDNQERRIGSNDDPLITVESVTTLDQKIIESENTIFEKTEFHDENDVNDINFLQR